MSFDPKLIDELLKNYKTPEDFYGDGGILKQLKKAMMERVLEGEMEFHLGYKKHENSPKSKNARNGKSSKTIISDDNESIQIDIPRDRNSEFEPVIIKKHERRSNSFNDMIISLYSRGLSTSEIKGHIEDQYGTEVSKELISHITNTVHEEVKAFRNRLLENLYPILFFDAIRVKIRDSGRVINKAVYLALGVNLDGQKELLGMWIEENEGAKFWLNVMTELKNRGLNDIFIACIDGLKGFPDAINTVFPETEIQLCIVHQVRNSLKFVSWKDRKEVATDLKEIYRAPTEETGLEALEIFENKWNDQYPVISKSWRRNWDNLQTFGKFPAEIRKVIYTTNAIESVNMSLRKVTKTRASFPNDDALYKMFYLALKNISKRWTMPIQNWNLAMNRFSIIYENRLTEFTQNYL